MRTYRHECEQDKLRMHREGAARRWNGLWGVNLMRGRQGQLCARVAIVSMTNLRRYKKLLVRGGQTRWPLVRPSELGKGRAQLPLQ